jgi:hypothetical protein
MVQIGVTAASPFDELNDVVNELLVASRRMGRLMTRPERSLRSPGASERHHKQLLEVDSIFYIFYAGSEEDPIAPRVDALVAEIECTCKGIIQGRGSLFSLNWRPWRRER